MILFWLWLTYTLVNQLPYDAATQLCNVAASLAIEQVGYARVTLSDLAHRLSTRYESWVLIAEQLFVREVLKKKPSSADFARC